MSYDIDIITHKKPNMSLVESFLEKQEEIKINKLSKATNLTIGMTVVLKESHEVYITLDGPFEIDNDYGDGIFADLGLPPRWLIQFFMQGATQKDNEINAIKNIAKQIADIVHGAAYDMQESKIFWPELAQKSIISFKKEERISLVELSWFVGESCPHVDVVNKYLQTVQDLCREALPVRYGEYEPFPGRYNKEQPEKFVKECLEICKKYGYIFWDSAYPCFSGSLFTAKAASSKNKYRSLAATKINMSFDGSILERDNDWCEKIVRLFEAIAKNIGAFYAGGYVIRNVILRKNLLFDTQSEKTPLPKSKGWLGLPPEPLWLSWFGDPYKDLVKKTIEPFITTYSEEGILVRMGKLPQNIDQLKCFEYRLPDELLFQKPNDNITELIKNSDKIIDIQKLFDQCQPKPAKVIPSLSESQGL